MPVTKDTFDVWSEDALEYVRDQLRTNTTVGFSSQEGVKVIEIGDPLAALAAGLIPDHGNDLPAIWINPQADTIRRLGGVLAHRISVDVTVLQALSAYSTAAEFADAQQAFRKLHKRVYNEVLHLRDTGATAGHWSDWEPSGTIQPILIEIQTEGGSSGIYGARLPFVMTVDRKWISGA